LETYRTQYKRWRDVICMQFLGRVSTSSAKFQDNLFEENAIPPNVLSILGKENRKNNGVVEAYKVPYLTLKKISGQLKIV
jgi:hypothetical protein